MAVKCKQHVHVRQPFLGFSFFLVPFLNFYTVGVESVACDAFRDLSRGGGVLLMPCLKRLFQQTSYWDLWETHSMSNKSRPATGAVSNDWKYCRHLKIYSSWCPQVIHYRHKFFTAAKSRLCMVVASYYNMYMYKIRLIQTHTLINT